MPEKWAQHTGSSDRILGLYALLLFSKRRYSLSHLSSIFNCSKQTIIRHLEQIEGRSEIELVQEFEGNQKFVSVRSPKRDANLTVDADSLEYLALCRDIVSHLLPSEVHKEIAQTVSVASYLLSGDDLPAPGSNHMAGTFTKGAIDYSPKQAIIESVLVAIREARWVRLKYESATKRTANEMRVRPLKLVAYREGLYLLFSDDEDSSPRMMPLHRIDTLEILDDEFDISLLKAAAMPGTFGVIAGEPFSVTARVSASATRYVTERTWSDDQKIRELTDGGIEITFSATSDLEIIAWVLGFAGEVELLKPQHMRDEIDVRLQRMLATYAGEV